MYIIIDEQYRIYQAPVLSGKIRALGRKGKVSIVNIRVMRGMNCMKLNSPEGLQGDFGENEWSDIQVLPKDFTIEDDQ